MAVTRPPGERQVRITADLALQAGGRQVRIEICDNGEGIEPEVRERLFEPFFTTRTKGTGLGLAIVRQIAELHGGEVELRDNRPCGTCVVLTLPQTPAVVDETQGQDEGMDEEKRA